MSANDETPRLSDFATSLSTSTSTKEGYPAFATQEQAFTNNPTSSSSNIGITTAFYMYPGANTPYSNTSDINSTPKVAKLAATTNDETGNIPIHPNGLIASTRHRASSSISMRDVPDFMSAGQLLSPEGLRATSKLFENTIEQGCGISPSFSPFHDSDSTLYPLATPCLTFNEHTVAEEAGFHIISHDACLQNGGIAVGIGITGVEKLFHARNGPKLDCGYDGADDVYELEHPGEEGGGTPVKSTKKRRRNDSDVDGEYKAIDHYRIEDIDSDGEGSVYGGVKIDDDCMSLDDNSDDENFEENGGEHSDSDDDAPRQGGAPVSRIRPNTSMLRLPSNKVEIKYEMEMESEEESEDEHAAETYEEEISRHQRKREQLRRKDMDILSPFPAFDEALASILHARGGQYVMMPLRRMSQGTLDYVQRSRC